MAFRRRNRVRGRRRRTIRRGKRIRNIFVSRGGIRL